MILIDNNQNKIFFKKDNKMKYNYKNEFGPDYDPIYLEVSFITDENTNMDLLEKLIKNGSYEEAKKIVVLLKIETTQSSAYDGVAACIALYLDDYKAARENIDSFISILNGCDDLQILETLIRMIYILFKKNDYKEAIEYCELTVDFLSYEINFEDFEEGLKFRRNISKFHDLYKINLALTNQIFSQTDIKIIDDLVEEIINGK